MAAKPKLRIGLIGSGFMGKAHVFGFATAARVFDLPYEVELHTLADVTLAGAQAAAAGFGFALIELGYGYVFDYFALGKALLKLHEPN